MTAKTTGPIKGVLIQLSYNMWYDAGNPLIPEKYADTVSQPRLRFDDTLWRDLVGRMAEAGFNMVVLDLGDGVRYESHPEIAAKGAWSTKKLRREIARLRQAGLEPIPKMNFSACHDHWLGKYSRMVSTDVYYRVVKDLIAEAADLFGGPRLFHLGMDEEQYHDQEHYQYVVIRQYDLWWRDFYFLVDQVERRGARAWIWSDLLWNHPDVFRKRMPKSVLQSNWYYGASFSRKLAPVQGYLNLEELGYDQVPTPGNFVTPVNVERTVRFCARHIAPERLRGFLLASWRPTVEARRADHVALFNQARKAFARWEAGRADT